MKRHAGVGVGFRQTVGPEVCHLGTTQILGIDTHDEADSVHEIGFACSRARKSKRLLSTSSRLQAGAGAHPMVAARAVAAWFATPGAREDNNATGHARNSGWHGFDGARRSPGTRARVHRT